MPFTDDYLRENTPMSDLAFMLRNLATSLESTQWGGSFVVPPELGPFCTAMGKGLNSLAEFTEQLERTAGIADNIEGVLQREASARKERDQQVLMGFDSEREVLVAVVEQQSAVMEAQSETITAIHRKLNTLLDTPESDLVAAHETLELLRSTSSDGAPRELVTVLEKLDAALTTDHVEKAARKMKLFQRVVAEAEDLLEFSEGGEDQTGLREALADVQDAIRI